MAGDLKVGSKERQSQGTRGSRVQNGHIICGAHPLEEGEESGHGGGCQAVTCELSHHHPVAAPGAESDFMTSVSSSPRHPYCP